MLQCRDTQVCGLAGINVQYQGHLSVLASISSHFAQRGHLHITQLGSEPHVASSLASLCLRSCKRDFLVIILGLKDVWSRLSLVTIFAKEYRLDYDQPSHSGHSISRSRLELGWDECVPCPVPPLFCREKLCLRGEGMRLLELVNFMGGGSDLIAISSWEKKYSKFSDPLEGNWIFLSRTVLRLWLCLASAK